MKKITSFLIIAVLSLCIFTGCGSIDVPLDEDTVNAYFTNDIIPKNVEFVYEDTDGISKLMSIQESSNVFMGSYFSNGSKASLSGQYNGTWYYGWGTKDKLLVAYGNEKDSVYKLMQGYEEYTKEKTK